MILPFRFYKLRRIIINQWQLIVSFAVFLLLLLVVFIFYARFNAQKKEVDLMSEEVVMLKNRFNTLKYNKSLTEDQIKEYNKLLASLIPETEDFFSIIYALEEISTVSHFEITNYEINIGKTSREKLTLTAEGRGNSDEFLNFLQQYQFAGGRLVTSDQIQYGGMNSGSTRITLNFYSKRFAFNETVQVPQLSKEEIQKLLAIKQKIKFQFSSSDYQSVTTDYAIKNDPFTSVVDE